MTSIRELNLLRRALLSIMSAHSSRNSALHERIIRTAVSKKDGVMLHAFVDHVSEEFSISLIRDVIAVQRKLSKPYEKGTAARDIEACARVRKSLRNATVAAPEGVLGVYELVIERPMITLAVTNIIDEHRLTTADEIMGFLKRAMSE